MWCHMPLILGPGVLDYVRAAPRVRPASKQVIANLPVIMITEEALKKLGEDADCYICKEDLEEHNSSPICRHELQTDDHEYESWKEREEEAEEDRKGAANAIGGGEYMYVASPPHPNHKSDPQAPQNHYGPTQSTGLQREPDKPHGL
ncbi:hypothetical protein ACFX13_016832 [Malus domestica]